MHRSSRTPVVLASKYKVHMHGYMYIVLTKIILVYMDKFVILCLVYCVCYNYRRIVWACTVLTLHISLSLICTKYQFLGL